ncbi:MAG: type II secretion system protein GspL [Lysobacterales bacterium]
MAAEYIILSLAGRTPQWWHPQHGQGQGELSRIPAQGRLPLVVLVPGREVLLSRVSLPAGSRQRLLQALPFAMEDQLVQDVDHYHFALGPKLKLSPGGDEPSASHIAAAVSAEAMERWMATLNDAGLEPDVMAPLPLALALPERADQANVLIDGPSALVRCGTQEAFESSLGDLALMLSLNPQIKQLQVADPEHQWQDSMTTLPTQLVAAAPWPQGLEVTPSKMGLNLLLGRWQARGDSAARTAKVWRWAAAALCAAGLMVLVGRYLEVADLKQQMSVLDAAARQQVLAVVSPIPPGRSYREVLTASLSRSRGAGGGSQNGFFYLLEIVGPALVQDGGINLSSINFRSDGLMLDLTAGSLGQVESLRRQITEQAPVAVVIESSETVVSGTRVRMRIGAGDAG